MSLNYYNINNIYSSDRMCFKSNTSNTNLIQKPIDKVENVISNTVDTFTNNHDNEEKKRSNKTAIAAGSTVIVLSALVALLNPNFSGKLVQKFKNLSTEATANINKGNNSLKNKIYKFFGKTWSGMAKSLQFINTINSTKDVAFQKLCTKTKGVKLLMAKPHKTTTKVFDNISRHTVKLKYSLAKKKLNSLENLITYYKANLPHSEQCKIESKLNEIKTMRNYFSESEISKRLLEQEKSMSNLENEFTKKLETYLQGFKQKDSDKIRHFKDNMTFWAEDIMMNERNKLEQQGINNVDALMGDSLSKKGAYNEILEILAPYIKTEDKDILNKSLQKANKTLKNASHAENIEYFNKKRDLMLGGAPTDIVTALFGIGLSGIAVGNADSKEDKISRALTIGFPALAGIGTSMALTALLYSGSLGLVGGALASIGLSKLGSSIDKQFNHRTKIENQLC